MYICKQHVHMHINNMCASVSKLYIHNRYYVCRQQRRSLDIRVASWDFFIPTFPILILWKASEWNVLVYLRTIWYMLGAFGTLCMCSFGIFCGLLVHCRLFWYVVPRIIWQPCWTWTLMRKLIHASIEFIPMKKCISQRLCSNFFH
jgi:hypothetical protein